MIQVIKLFDVECCGQIISLVSVEYIEATLRSLTQEIEEIHISISGSQSEDRNRYIPNKILENYCYTNILCKPVAVAERSEAWSVFDSSEAVIEGWNPALGMDA
jgi:hypothetical protein